MRKGKGIEDAVAPESNAEKLHSLQMSIFTSASARYASYGNILLRVLVLVYCLKRFQLHPFQRRLSLFISLDAFISLFFASIFKDLQQTREPYHFARLLAATLYGACHAAVLLNLLDRAFERNGLWDSVFCSLLVGGNTMRDFVNFYGFKLKKALFQGLKDRTARGAFCRARMTSGLFELIAALYASVSGQFMATFVAGYFLSVLLESMMLEIGLRRVCIA